MGVCSPSLSLSQFLMSQPECPNCRRAMEPGFLIDKADHSMPTQQQWADGEPERSFWTGLKLKGHVKIAVATYRCPKCGLLQSFALSDLTQ